MHIIINHSSMVPIYEQIVDQIKTLIINHELEADTCLPSVRALSVELKISALTVKKAYDNLEAAGFTVTVHGKGTFVAASNQQFLKEAEKCRHPLEEAELRQIWASAVKFGVKVAAQEGYIPPEQYNQDFLLMPEDFSDVGQATVLSREYEDRLRYSPSTDYMVFNGSFWEESQPNAQGIAQELTARQLKEAENEIERCMVIER